MKIIPVIDLKDGLVVSARQGKRNTYQAIKSPLCISNSIHDVINGFLSIYEFKYIYIADLNAISNNGNNQNIINEVISKNSNIEFWVDNGTKLQNLPLIPSEKYRLIIGSENQSFSNRQPLEKQLKDNILSLDFFPHHGYTGPSELIKNSELWPKDIIIMTLDKVGGNSGPDFAKLKDFCDKHPDKNFIAAGGIRDESDLLRLQKMGINYALIASSLHTGKINAATIKKLQTKKYPE